MDRLGKSILLSLLSFCLTGCPVLIGAGVSVGTYHVVQGDLTRLYRARYDRAWDVALLTLEEMEMTVVEKTKGETVGRIDAKRFDGSPAKVAVTQKALDVIQLQVRIGPVGDRAKAEIFHERFRKNLFD